MAERYVTIDAVRGVAVLGILLMNIVSMGLPVYAYVDPTYAGGAQGANLWAWGISYVLIDGKTRALFTMLFGASLILVADRAEQAGENPARVHYARMFWLLVFGLIHAWLIWYGDILYDYAIVGALLFFARKAPAPLLLLAGAAITLGFALDGLVDGPRLAHLRDLAQAPGAAPAAVAAWREALAGLVPAPGVKAAEIAGYTGGFLDALRVRAPMAAQYQTSSFLEANAWDVAGCMLIGMGLYRLGVFTGRCQTRVYLALIALGYLVVLPAYIPLTHDLVGSGFDPLIVMRNDELVGVLRIPVALAHASVVILIARRWPETPVIARLSAVGQMALSNYLAASLIGTTIFYGYGLGLFGALERHELYFVVAGIWAFQILWSPWWLGAFRYGPFEWAWRSLARGRLQPLRRVESAGAAAA